MSMQNFVSHFSPYGEFVQEMNTFVFESDKAVSLSIIPVERREKYIV